MAKEKSDFELHIDDKFRVVYQQDNFVLQEYEEVISKQTKETRQEWRFKGYFGNSLSGALNRYLTSENIKHEETTNVHKLIETIHQAEKRIKNVVSVNKLKLNEQLKEMNVT
jgi:hypothetical protein